MRSDSGAAYPLYESESNSFTAFFDASVRQCRRSNGSTVARLKEDGDSLVMPGVPQDESAMLVESRPKLFYFTDHYRDYPMVLIRLSKARRATVEPLLRRHWRTLASKKAVKEFDSDS